MSKVVISLCLYFLTNAIAAQKNTCDCTTFPVKSECLVYCLGHSSKKDLQQALKLDSGSAEVITKIKNRSNFKSLGSFKDFIGSKIFEPIQQQINNYYFELIAQQNNNGDNVVEKKVINNYASPGSVATVGQTGGTNIVNNTEVPKPQIAIHSWPIKNKMVAIVEPPKDEHNPVLVVSKETNGALDSLFRNDFDIAYISEISRSKINFVMSKTDIINGYLSHKGQLRWSIYRLKGDELLFFVNTPEDGIYTFSLYSKSPITDINKLLVVY